MAEAAIVTPFVMMMILSVIWGALLFRTYLSANHAVDNGARRASIASTSFDADWQILNEIKPSLNAINRNGINKIVIYPAADFGDAPSEACLSSGAGCNVYTAADLNRVQPTAAGQWPGDVNFPEASRLGSGASGLVGVYVELRPGANGLLLPAPSVISAHKVLRLELS